MHRFAIGESKFARQTHTLAAYNARRDLWDQGGQSPEVRKERPNLIDVALEYRVAGTNAPGSALWSDAVFIVDSYSLHTHSRSSTFLHWYATLCRGGIAEAGSESQILWSSKNSTTAGSFEIYTLYPMRHETSS